MVQFFVGDFWCRMGSQIQLPNGIEGVMCGPLTEPNGQTAFVSNGTAEMGSAIPD